MNVPAYIKPPEYDLVTVSAFQALARGDADARMQRIALDWLIEKAAGTYDLSFSPDGDRATSFHEGRRFVGLQVIKMTKLDVDKLKKATQ
jgi:hypothetical protein